MSKIKDPKNSKDLSNLKNNSLWQKTKNYFNQLFNQKINNDDSEETGGTGGKSGKLKGQGFIDPKAATHVKDPETILYDELIRDPAAMQALKKLTQQHGGQITVSEIASNFEVIKNSTTALQSIADSPFAPPEAKARARNELALKRLKKFQEQQGITPEGPTPGLRK